MLNDIKKDFSAFDLYHKPKQKTQFPVESLVPPGLSMLTGGIKEGKSILALQIALAIGSGMPLFNHYPTKKTDVLYLSLEESPELITERLQKICIDIPAPQNITFKFWWPSQGIDLLIHYLEENINIKMVIIDILAKFSNGIRGYNREYEEANKLHNLIKIKNISILMLHHTVKNRTGNLNDVRGDGGFPAVADSILDLKSDKSNYTGRLSVSSRFGSNNFLLKYNKNNDSWSFLGNAEDVDLTNERQDILEIIGKEYGPVQVNKIAKELGKNISTVSNLLKKLKNQGLVSKPSYRIYDLTPSGREAFNKLLIN